LPTPPSIDAVLLDLGGVLIELVGVEQMIVWSPHLDDSDTLWARWLASPAVRRYERGEGGRDEFARGVIEEFALPVDRDTFIAGFSGWPRQLFPDSAALLAQIRARYRVASLSNTNELHWSRFAQDWGLPGMFDANFPSFEVKRIKPDADYFEHVLETLGVPAQRALFLDDNAANVAAAQRVGIHARRAVGPAGVREAFAALGLAL
jgi:putative hydrolase of the HAD superfamily